MIVILFKIILTFWMLGHMATALAGVMAYAERNRFSDLSSARLTFTTEILGTAFILYGIWSWL